jgi:hypothetical protein
MRIAVFVFTGFVLLLLNLWYIRSIYRTYISTDLPEVVAPFQFIGRDDPKGDKGRALAQMLVSRLDSLQREIAQAQKALEEATPQQAVVTRGDVPNIVDRPEQIYIRTRVLDIPELQVKVSGVEVSNLLTWGYRAVAEGRSIRVSLYYPEGAQKVTVAAGLDTRGIGDLWISEIASNDLGVIEEIANEIIHQVLIREGRIPESSGLDREEYGQLVSSLKSIAELNRKVRQGYAPPLSRYSEVVNRLEPLIERTPRWRALIRLTAQAAENGRNLAKARDLYGRELALVDPKKEPDNYNKLKDKVKELADTLGQPALTQASPVARAAIVSTWPGNILAIPSGVGMKGAPRIAVLGGVPLPEILKGLDHEVVNQKENGEEDDSTMREHIATVVEAVQIVAPQAHFIFAEMRSFSGGAVISDLLNSLRALSKTKPHVLLVPLRAQHHSPEYAAEFARLAKMFVIVVAGGNDGLTSPVQFDEEKLLNDLISVAAVDKKGRPADFSSKSDQAFWAPGVDIPLQIVVDKLSTPQIRNGTSYSAALAAGVVARVLDERKDLSPQEVIKLLRETSKAIADGGPPVLNLAAALEKLNGQ